MQTGAGEGGLYLAPVPEPAGDPAALTAAAGRFSAAHGEIERGRAVITGAAGQAGGWSGAGAAGFASAAGSVAAVYGMTGTALAAGARALTAYAADLYAAKAAARQANAAVGTANAHARALLDAQSAAAQRLSDSDTAARAADTAHSAALASPHSPAAQAAAVSARQAAADAATAAAAAKGSAAAQSANWQASHGQAVALISQARTAERQAATRAAAGFDAAASELAGKTAHPARGGARPVTGGGAWSQAIDIAASANAKAAPALDAYGAFGAFVIGKKALAVAERTGELSAASGKYSESLEGVWNRTGGFFGPDGLYANQAKFNVAQDAERGAVKEFTNSVIPEAGKLSGTIGRAGLGVGMASDVLTIVHPSKSFGPAGMFGGLGDQINAGVNFAASGTAIAGSLGYLPEVAVMAALPGTDVVVVGALLAGTTAYVTAEYIYPHLGAISRGVTSAADWAGSKAASAADWAGSKAASIGGDLGGAASDVGHLLGI